MDKHISDDPNLVENVVLITFLWISTERYKYDLIVDFFNEIGI